jgi:putative transcriptional regulator
VDYLEVYDVEHSDAEDRFIAVGPIARGVVLVVWTERVEDVIRIISARWATKGEVALIARRSTKMANNEEIPELTQKLLATAMRASVRKRLMRGVIESGQDIVALRRFIGLTQSEFAQAMGISVHTLRNWEQGRRQPHGSALALLRIAAKHPRIIRENIEAAA